MKTRENRATAIEEKIYKEEKIMKTNDGKVAIMEITVNGVTYTKTSNNYFYRKDTDSNKRTRIPETEWEQAYDEYIQQGQDIADAQAEENFRQSKKRRSKDVAYDGHDITLTSKQVDFIHHIPDTGFYEKGLDSALWCDVLVCEISGQFTNNPFVVGAMLSTLREKNLIEVGYDRVNGKKAKFFTFTDLGKMVAKELGLS